MPPPVLRRPTDEEARFLAQGLNKPSGKVIDVPAVTVTGQRTGVPPWKFGLALGLLAVVWFLVPKGSHWWLALLVIGGALAAANDLAKKRGVPSPLESIGF